MDCHRGPLRRATHAVLLALLVATTSSCTIVRGLWKTREFEQVRARYSYVEGTSAAGSPAITG